MATLKPQSGRVAIELAVAALALVGFAAGLCGIHVSRAEMDTKTASDEAWQVTVFSVIATPGGKTSDSRLANIKAQLNTLLPKHGFKLLDAQSKRIVATESVTCNLDDGYTVVASLVAPVNENGKIQLRCELFQDQARKFSTLVKTPLNQLFFCQQALEDGSQLLIGVGGR